MITRSFQGLSLSALGMGAMRLPTCGDAAQEIDMDATRAMVAYAIEHGVNYFDTAWGYHGGQSEPVLGTILKDYPRGSFFLASKFPGYDLSNMGKVEEIFEAQLERCRVDYFDFYLFHNVCEANIDAYLDRSHGIYAYLRKQKENGRIRHLGFSTHGSVDTITRFLDAYGEGMEFCQIQLNWLDWTLQNAEATVALLREHRLPIWVMEPVRGGKLAALSAEHEAALKSLRPDATVVEWAFRFLQTFPDVAVTLSGMSNMQQLQENIATFETHQPLSAAETDALFDIAEAMTAVSSLPCTACRYCTDHCPKGLDIPRLIGLYNDFVFSDGGFVPPMVVRSLPKDKQPSACIGCRRCEAVCPQTIAIATMMRDFAERLAL